MSIIDELARQADTAAAMITPRLHIRRPETTVKTAKWSRVPTVIDIAEFTGLHCAAIYRQAVRDCWRCPCCDRTATECIRWSEIKGQHWRYRYADAWGMGWTISLTRHHCHNAVHPRFRATLICGDCNSADGAVKRRWGLPPEWSFSPCRDPALRPVPTVFRPN